MQLYSLIFFCLTLSYLTICLFFSLGKFFCVKWIEDIYDDITYNELHTFIIVLNMVMASLFVISYLLQTEALMVAFAVFGSAVSVISSIVGLVFFFLSVVVPFMENIHYNIKHKKGK